MKINFSIQIPSFKYIFFKKNLQKVIKVFTIYVKDDISKITILFKIIDSNLKKNPNQK